ncbi:MAG TPA: CdaR family protein, partial [Sphingobacteriaceae bacterium]
YIYEVNSVLNYRNAPINKAFHPLQGDTVTLKVEGTGWDLLFSKIRVLPTSVDVDVSELNTRNYVIIEKQLRQVNRQFQSSQQIVSIEPDTLYFDFSSRINKKIPVNLLYKIGFAPQHKVSGAIQISPAFVTVSGPAGELQDITKWDTDSLKASEVSADLTARVPLQPNRKNNIVIYPRLVDVRIPVSEFTEKTLEVPLEVVNREGMKNIRLYPEKVRITLHTSLNDYSRINESSFQATVDLANWRKKGFSQLPVEILRRPAAVEIVRVEPVVVDFIIHK